MDDGQLKAIAVVGGVAVLGLAVYEFLKPTSVSPSQTVQPNQNTNTTPTVTPQQQANPNTATSPSTSGSSPSQSAIGSNNYEYTFAPTSTYTYAPSTYTSTSNQTTTTLTSTYSPQRTISTQQTYTTGAFGTVNANSPHNNPAAGSQQSGPFSIGPFKI